MEADTVISQFGGDFSASAFAPGDNPDALPVIIPVYNRDSSTEIPKLPWTLGSLALASNESKQAVRPLVVINGPEDGPIPELCEAFGLKEGEHVLRQTQKGKVSAIQSGVKQLLDEEAYTGSFATIDDDVLIPTYWPKRVVTHMAQTEQDAVSGGTIRYYKVPEVSRIIVGLRNLGVPVREKQDNRRYGLCAHGNNQWFNAGADKIVKQAIEGLDPNIGRRGDAAIVAAIQAGGGRTLSMDRHRDGRVVTAGDRSKTLKDLVNTALRKSGSRYQDQIWSGMTAYPQYK